MRVVGAVLLAICVVLGATRAPHLRRAHPTATVSAPAAHHHHHARSHRSPAALAAPVALPAPELALADRLIARPDISLDRDPVALVARGPPIA
jgi:hypothetical protein